MCGAISGFHALIASGTTPKMVEKEKHILPIGYGAMVLEGFVAITALIAACSLEPGDYYAINTNKAMYAKETIRVQEKFGVDIRAKELTELEKEIGEAPHEKDGKMVGGLAGREGGAVTLAVGMAKIFSSLPGLKSWMSYWYHFVTMFEALFILTLLETGTRVARFIFQEFIVGWSKKSDQPEVAAKPSWVLNIIMSVVVCLMWGGLLYAGNLGLLWSMLGIANQLLASIALAVGTTFILMHAPKRVYAWCTFIPFVGVVITTYYASVYKIIEWKGLIETKFNTPETSFQAGLMKLVITLSVIMLILVTMIVIDSVRRWLKILNTQPDAVAQAAK
jgi:carbon starvation protein